MSARIRSTADSAIAAGRGSVASGEVGSCEFVVLLVSGSLCAAEGTGVDYHRSGTLPPLAQPAK